MFWLRNKKKKILVRILNLRTETSYNRIEIKCTRERQIYPIYLMCPALEEELKTDGYCEVKSPHHRCKDRHCYTRN